MKHLACHFHTHTSKTNLPAQEKKRKENKKTLEYFPLNVSLMILSVRCWDVRVYQHLVRVYQPPEAYPPSLTRPD